jgi:outer membrane protein assembly factor BamB
MHLAGVWARPSLSGDGLVYATCQNGFVQVVDSRTGRSRQKEMIERQAAYSTAIDGNLAFFHRGGQMFTLGRRGKILGLFTRPPKPLGAGLGSPALTSARIYVAGDGALVATNREASAPLWRHPLPEQTTALGHSAPVVAGAGTPLETVYVVDAQGTLHAVDGASGKALWAHPLGRPTAPVSVLRPRSAGAPALLPHLILVSTPNGEVLALTDAK